jgi:hypothetical protein
MGLGLSCVYSDTVDLVEKFKGETCLPTLLLLAGWGQQGGRSLIGSTSGFIFRNGRSSLHSLQVQNTGIKLGHWLDIYIIVTVISIMFLDVVWS